MVRVSLCDRSKASCVAFSSQVILQKSEVESMVHSPGDYILLSADKYEIKVILKNVFFFFTLPRSFLLLFICLFVCLLVK